MNEIILNICITAIAASLFSLLIPNDKFSKQIKLLLSCFFIVTVMEFIRNGTSCISEISNEFIGDITYNDYASAVNIMTAEKIADNIRIAVKEKLYEIYVFPEKISVDVNISDIGSISINEIIIYMNNESYNEKSESAVQLISGYYDNKINVKAEVSA